jgi:hypothetical protein
VHRCRWLKGGSRPVTPRSALALRLAGGRGTFRAIG